MRCQIRNLGNGEHERSVDVDETLEHHVVPNALRLPAQSLPQKPMTSPWAGGSIVLEIVGHVPNEHDDFPIDLASAAWCVNFIVNGNAMNTHASMSFATSTTFKEDMRQHGRAHMHTRFHSSAINIKTC